jgi:hypothetical protein
MINKNSQQALNCLKYYFCECKCNIGSNLHKGNHEINISLSGYDNINKQINKNSQQALNCLKYYFCKCNISSNQQNVNHEINISLSGYEIRQSGVTQKQGWEALDSSRNEGESL